MLPLTTDPILSRFNVTTFKDVAAVTTNALTFVLSSHCDQYSRASLAASFRGCRNKLVKRGLDWSENQEENIAMDRPCSKEAW